MSRTEKNERDWKCNICNKYYLETHAKSREYMCCEQKLEKIINAEKHMHHKH